MSWGYLETAVAIVLLLLTLPGTLELFFLTWGAILSTLKNREPSSVKSADSVKTVVIVPAHNEQEGLARTLNSLKACSGKFDIIVVADNCTDQTAEIAIKSGARVLERTNPTLRGKNYALHYAFEILLKEGYDLFAVVDADSVAAPNFIEEIQSLYNGGAEAIQVFYGILNDDQSERLRLMKISYFAFNLTRPLGRNFYGFSGGILGNGFALSRSVLEAIPFDVHSIVEDLSYHIRLVEAGKFVQFTSRTSILGDMPVEGKGVTTQRVRWEGGRLRAVLDYVPDLAKKVLQGQWRLIEPLFDLLTPPLAYYTLFLLLLLLFSSFRLYAVIALFNLAFHVLTSIKIGKGTKKIYMTLLTIPFYLIWKILLLGKIVKAASKDYEWQRTERTNNKNNED